MVRPLGEHFGKVIASDIYDYGAGYPQHDYLFGEDLAGKESWTISNPPFRLAEQFIVQAIQHSRHGVAMIVRSAFLEGIGRYRNLFSQIPPTDILQFSERVPMVKGRYDHKASSATAYCWLVWRLSAPIGEARLHWIAPCRKRLERAGDYA
jgi:hypothetical protein